MSRVYSTTYSSTAYPYLFVVSDKSLPKSGLSLLVFYYDLTTKCLSRTPTSAREIRAQLQRLASLRSPPSATETASVTGGDPSWAEVGDALWTDPPPKHETIEPQVLLPGSRWIFDTDGNYRAMQPGEKGDSFTHRAYG